ncbi:hypothetical protein [Pseudomonas capsici]|uniref:hypothetical protein n=1 Tax=Pseudomonas capsici TaxID=2810614 RepID=UPI0021F1FF80|nr:hypothetical protein [Pseudomonas capsici]MCV4285115.1 hypothetical protein [Pseudomonas capsici]
MAGPTPQPKVNQLVTKVRLLSAALFETGILNEIAWQAAFNESVELENTPHARHALISRVALFSLKGDMDNAKSTLELYLGRFGEDWMWHASRASIAPQLCRPDFVAEMIKHGPPDGDAGALESAMNFAAQSGQLISANKFLERLKIMKASVLDSERAHYLSEIAVSADYLNEAGVAESDVAERIALAWRVAQSHAKVARNIDLSANKEGVSYNFGIYAGVERCVEVQRHIDAALVRQFDDPLSEHLSIGVFPVAKGVV